ncbi:hypothetical protein GOODEAATRI_017586, partial [Goodea atripinnis]
KPVRRGLLPSQLDSDTLHPLLMFVNSDYSSQDCGSIPNLPNSCLCEYSGHLRTEYWTSFLDCLTPKPSGMIPQNYSAQ